MSGWQGITVEAEGTGISRPLSEQVNLLGGMLGHAIRVQAGEETFALVEELRLLCREAAQSGHADPRERAAERIAGLSLERIGWLLRAFTTFFHLVNQAEKQEIIRINRERARQASGDSARPESIAEAVGSLADAGLSVADVQRVLARLDVQPTFTAHPTEARRRAVLLKQRRIGELLDRWQDPGVTPEEREELGAELYDQVLLLLVTDDVAEERPTVDDEVRHGLNFLTGAVWEALPRIYRDVERALARRFGEGVGAVPPFLRYRTWMGGDRDGNPNVTAEVSRRTLAVQREAALQLYLGELRALAHELSISDRHLAVPAELTAALRGADDGRDGTGSLLPAQAAREPFRRFVGRLVAILQDELAAHAAGEAPRYRAADFAADLARLAAWLEQAGLPSLARRGRLAQLLVRVRSFGFHLASLDVRQHSAVHEEVVAELLRLGGVAASYGSLAEEQRQHLLTRELASPRSLLDGGGQPGAAVREALATLGVVRAAVAAEPGSVGSVVVSMTHAVSDVLEVLLLAKEAGLWSVEGGVVRSPLDVVPLLETIEDLEEAGDRLEALLEHPLYRRHLAARGDLQEVMIGYSDSNKDGGYWMANWAVHQAQREIGRACWEAGIDLRLFHGRGGTVGRGGGRSSQAILSLSRMVHNGRIRFTEQGEVISFRYSLPAIAHRHLEQVTSAMLRATAGVAVAGADRAGEAGEPDDEDRALVDRVAREAMAAYRELVDDPELWPWYVRVTPVEHISRLPIASRPVSRKGAEEVDFDGLRAIPWVFAWTQTRYNVPGWYGTGRALTTLLAEGEETLQRLGRLARRWPFFAAVLDNTERELARARLEIAERYAGLVAGGAELHRRIAKDFTRARQAVLAIRGAGELLSGDPVIRKSIALRNPYTDVLNLLQVELMRRWQRAAEAERPALREALFLSINGIAAAMQSTG